MSNTIKAFVRTGVASVTMATTVLGLGGFAAFAPATALAAFTMPAGLADGNVIKATGDIDLYIVMPSGYKRLFVSPQIFNLYGHLGGFASVKEVSPEVRDAFKTSPFFRVQGDTKVYALETTSEDAACLHWVNITEAAAKAAWPDFANGMIFEINAGEKAIYCAGADYTSASQVQMYSRGGATPAPVGGALQGTVGALEKATFMTSLSNEKVGEGDGSVPVVGLNLKADDGSDLKLLATKIEIACDSCGSYKLTDYADKVTVKFDGKKVAEADVSDFTKDGALYSKTMSLSGDPILRMDTTKELVVEVTANENIDSLYLGSSFAIWFDNLRYVDAQGAITTETNYDNIGNGYKSFFFESFATAADLELKLSENSANPDDTTMSVDDQSTTEDVLLAAGTWKAVNGDVHLNELWVPIEAYSYYYDSLEDADYVAESFSLLIDGEEVGTADAADDCDDDSCYFADLNSGDGVDISEGDSVTVKVTANILGTDDMNLGDGYGDGSTLMAGIEQDSGWIDAESENGDSLTNSELTGPDVEGGVITFRQQGINVTKQSLSAVKTAGSADIPDEGTYTIKFKVSAFGEDDLYILKDCNYWFSYDNGVTFDLIGDDWGNVTCDLTSEAEDTGASFKVNADTEESFTLTVWVKGADEVVKVGLYGVEWGFSDGDEYDTYYIPMDQLTQFQTSGLNLSSNATP